jgi:hypothetical protein
MNIWVPVIFAIQLGLILIHVFRFNFLFSVASFCLSIAESQFTGTPYWVNMASWLIGWGQLLAGLLIVIFGKKNARDIHLG